MQNAKDLRAISQLLKQAQTMIDKYNLPPQKFLEQLGLLQTQPETEIVFEKTGGRFHHADIANTLSVIANSPMSAVTTSSVPPFPISKSPIPTSKAMKQAQFTAIKKSFKN
ncbi:hypothetical protein [Pseudanabaena sp. ABRG5-3]|uniref:hypothetical protein n=1 Tax=Pseudanabaena sp. ABRG5-3 TaxID=685565 RepID=UPI000DC6DB46|nr:hypothetical protein [Pseudanabaena sp. ABRG5-3]BBC22835.1 hypothetical protein ABRG53_0578 [Pseudanabaena sp. ABRG5-3]